MKISNLARVIEWTNQQSRPIEEPEKLDALSKKGCVIVEMQLAPEPGGSCQTLLTKDSADAMSFLTHEAITRLNEEAMTAWRAALHDNIAFAAEVLEEMGVQLDGDVADAASRARMIKSASKT